MPLIKQRKEPPSWGKRFGRSFLEMLPRLAETAGSTAIRSAIDRALANKYAKEAAEREDYFGELAEQRRGDFLEKQAKERRIQQLRDVESQREQQALESAARAAEGAGEAGVATGIRTQRHGWAPATKQIEIPPEVSRPVGPSGRQVELPGVKGQVPWGKVSPEEKTPAGFAGRFEEWWGGLPEGQKRPYRPSQDYLELERLKQTGRERLQHIMQKYKVDIRKLDAEIDRAQAKGDYEKQQDLLWLKSQLGRADVRYTGGGVPKPEYPGYPLPWEKGGKKAKTPHWKEEVKDLTPAQRDAYWHYRQKEGASPEQARAAALRVAR